ncbi:hypothetical protein, partial [Neisseria meningitidis]|uniref:hypothetical protein n=1 Tax=Neisseria meningitidis TaxID=487 RepID=UPI001E541FB7
VLDSRFRGNDGMWVRGNDAVQVSVRMDSSFPRRRESGISMPQEFIGKNKTLPPSFPRKWESRNEKQQEFIGNDRN